MAKHHNLPKQTKRQEEQPLPASSSSGEFPPDALRELFEIQRQELLIRQQEADIRKHEIDQQKELGLETIKAQERVLLAQYDTESSSRKRGTGLLLALLAAATLIIGISLFLDKEMFVVEAVKAIVYLIVGGIGGGGWVASRRNNNEDASVPVP